MKFLHSLSVRVLGGLLALLMLFFGVYSYVAIHFHTQQMMSHVLEAASRMSDVIKKSTHYSMLLNRKDDVYQIITMIGREPGVEGIRIYNKRGEIMFSTNKAEEGTVVDMHAEACFACHEREKPLQSLPMDNRMRTYTSAGGYRVLGLINPIRNEPGCSNGGCHAHSSEKTVLGVLDVRMSLEQVDHDITHAQAQLVGYSILGVLGISIVSLLFLYSTILRPVKRIIVGTQQISSGNLNYEIQSTSQDELGHLAHSFNAMTASLRTVMEENEKWSHELEKRVREKTDELKRIHEQILQIEKMASLGKLSATVAHELNNPLEGILTYAKLIAKRLRKEPAQSEKMTQTIEELDLIIRETERCGSIVKNLLLFSRKQVGEFALVPVRQIIEKAEQLVRHHLQIFNIRFEARYCIEDIKLMCDENQIQQAFVALFVNAVEAMPDGGSLLVDVTKPAAAESLQIKISDTGIGIPPDDLPHIFEPFFTTKKEGKGTGLGLSVVYGVIERHGGRIDVQSQVGKGTTFVLVFPPTNCSGSGQGEWAGNTTPQHDTNKSHSRG